MQLSQCKLLGCYKKIQFKLYTIFNLFMARFVILIQCILEVVRPMKRQKQNFNVQSKSSKLYFVQNILSHIMFRKNTISSNGNIIMSWFCRGLKNEHTCRTHLRGCSNELNEDAYSFFFEKAKVTRNACYINVLFMTVHNSAKFTNFFFPFIYRPLICKLKNKNKVELFLLRVRDLSW